MEFSRSKIMIVSNNAKGLRSFPTTQPKNRRGASSHVPSHLPAYDTTDTVAVSKWESDHKLKTRRSQTGGRSSSCYDYDLEESFTSNQSSHSKSLSIGSSLRKSVRSLISPKSTHSAGRRARKQHDCDDDESFVDRQEDDDYDEFAHDHDDDDNYVDQDKIMVILCKELEITCDDDE